MLDRIMNVTLNQRKTLESHDMIVGGELCALNSDTSLSSPTPSAA